VVQMERGGRGVTPQSHMSQHSIPPHLQQSSLVHPSDQRNADSPMLTSMYGVQRVVYPHPNSAHQAVSRPYGVMYSDPNERQHSQSPSYPTAYVPGNNISASEGESSRVSSPYAVGEVSLIRRSYSPPPAHGRYPGSLMVTQNSDTSLSERQRQEQAQTPPLTSQLPQQGDSLLLLLQVGTYFILSYH
jgi:hypothetical protein